MKFRTFIAIILACAAAGFAQEHIADSLRNGILEEDSKQNPRAAIQQYQAVMAQFAEARQTAATALFRMAECYRKQGNRNAAVASYQRLLKDFADQTKLAAQSRTVLATAYNTAPSAPPAAGNQSDRAKFDKLMDAQKQEQAKIDDARARYRLTIENEITLAEKQVSLATEKYKGGVEGYDAVSAQEEKLLHLKRDLAAFDAGMAPTAK